LNQKAKKIVEPKLQKIKIERTAHVYTLGEEPNEAENIWLIFHGYGQLASGIIRKFDGFENKKLHVIAPEGSSIFYFRRNPIIIGASWMTRRHREDEIEDYLKYIDAVYGSLNLRDDQTFNVLGFSQGSSTMMRWLNHARPKVSKLINWAGEFPWDVDFKMMTKYLDTIPIKYYCVGDNDEFVTAERFQTLKLKIVEIGSSFQIKRFIGKHEINRKLLLDIIDE